MNGKLRHLGVSGLLVGSLLLGGPAPARAGTLTKTVDCGAGQTIAGALQSLLAALPGTLRVIITGICNENVTVARDDVILVAGVGGATVNGPDLTINTITVNADRVTIDGLEVTGGRNGITAQGAGKLTIRNCDVHDTGRSGIAIGYGTSATIDNCLVQNNPLDGINALGGTIIVTNSTISANARNGIFILFGGVGQIGVNDRFDAAGPNTISGNGGSGIDVSTGSSAVIVANTISGNGTNPAFGRFGINVFMASASIFGGNNITGNQGHGVSVNASTVQIGGLTVGDVVLPVTTISGNGTAVVNSSGVNGFNGASINIRQTTISGNTGSGVTLNLQSRAFLFDNVMITGNTGNGVLGFDGVSIQITQTTISMNTGPGIVLFFQSRVNMFGASVQVVNNTGHGISVNLGSAANFGTAASVTGNGAYGLFCGDGESSYVGNTTGIVGNTAGTILPTCTGF